ncbi:hypothetical protein BDP67DRAFT_279927 [Colletotrichum lupini]|nr:hypothetical protein BDP67DRAFT_279927 [Colletotrichum lupini]
MVGDSFSPIVIIPPLLPYVTISYIPPRSKEESKLIQVRRRFVTDGRGRGGLSYRSIEWVRVRIVLVAKSLMSFLVCLYRALIKVRGLRWQGIGVRHVTSDKKGRDGGDPLSRPFHQSDTLRIFYPVKCGITMFLAVVGLLWNFL